jgi:RNA polymerase sigma factor (sigma-70 family)
MMEQTPTMTLATAVVTLDRGDTRDRVDFGSLSTEALDRLCAREIACHQQGEVIVGVFGFELFRRAVVERDDIAWTALSARYALLVRHWLDPWPVGETIEEGIAATFERFWIAVDAVKFGHFASLAAVLQYLKLCARSARLDRARSARVHARECPLNETIIDLPGPATPEEQATRDDATAVLWRAVHGALPDERERTVIHLCYVCGLPPREVCARYGLQFPNVADVYRLKRRALNRLRKEPAIHALC